MSCLVDEMTSDVGSPIDRLAGAAVAVSKGLGKLLLARFYRWPNAYHIR